MSTTQTNFVLFVGARSAGMSGLFLKIPQITPVLFPLFTFGREVLKYGESNDANTEHERFNKVEAQLVLTMV